MSDNYDDIINLPHHTSAKHQPMPMLSRAAQFAPFAALTGFNAAIDETARLTDAPMELDDYDNARLNRKFARLAEALPAQPTVTLICFVADQRKAGGTYQAVTGQLKAIDDYAHQLVLTDGRRIDIGTIVDLDDNQDDNQGDY